MEKRWRRHLHCGRPAKGAADAAGRVGSGIKCLEKTKTNKNAMNLYREQVEL